MQTYAIGNSLRGHSRKQTNPDNVPMTYATRPVDSFGQPTTVTAQDMAALESSPDGFWRPAHDKACRRGKPMRDLDMAAYHRRLTFEPRNPKKVT